jgi:hypothetical protein
MAAAPGTASGRSVSTDSKAEKVFGFASAARFGVIFSGLGAT